ncbi:conserved hypothetical protein [Sphingomonas sp. EC-HK361]|uniref:DUF1800 domain-containing protein n=1 Tax=Sphingomonas sp. EC-HK361 TaxID=2038397 RepID=UPI00125BBE21|nr:DUF1800 domain-containing protein [Sphingomonas sp. EC-HK361]VVT04450.1 conserved hypothetical protein [Sphingomonas sp. EC-HK361]
MSEISIALNRFGYGLRSGEAAPSDGKAWLLGQFARYDPKPDAIANAPTTAGVAADLAAYFREQQAMRRANRQGMGGQPPQTPAQPQPQAMVPAPDMAALALGARPAKPARSDEMKQARQFAARANRLDYAAGVGARAATTLASDTPFMERMVHFWSNHFAVSADKLQVVGLAGPFEFEAIRPHVLGKFSDMLMAVEQHPAMLLYLDQAVSVGPTSPLGSRIAARGNRKIGLNENLAREIMELHTLGVRTGYTQADVTEFARAMTGWTVAGIGQGPGARAAGTDGIPGDFVFADALHEPGDRTIRGKRYPAGGVAQASAVLADLAVDPATATHIATKLSRHFAGDTPPPAMVARVRDAFLQSGGDLPMVYRAVIASPEAWVAAPVKFKTPWEWSVSSMRALGMKTVDGPVMTGLLNQLGQPMWKPGQPIGYDDIAGSWAGPDAVMRRVEAAERFATRAPSTIDARALAAKLYPAAVTPATTQALSRAESPGQALALLLVSPEAMRR